MIIAPGVAVVLLAQLLWLGWPCAAPPPSLLRVLRPIPFGVGVVCDFFFYDSQIWCSTSLGEPAQPDITRYNYSPASRSALEFLRSSPLATYRTPQARTQYMHGIPNFPNFINALYTRIGSNRGNLQSTTMYRIHIIHTHSNGTTSRKSFPAHNPNFLNFLNAHSALQTTSLRLEHWLQTPWLPLEVSPVLPSATLGATSSEWALHHHCGAHQCAPCLHTMHASKESTISQTSPHQHSTSHTVVCAKLDHTH